MKFLSRKREYIQVALFGEGLKLVKGVWAFVGFGIFVGFFGRGRDEDVLRTDTVLLSYLEH